MSENKNKKDSASSKLLGLDLDGGWTVTEVIQKSSTSTGGKSSDNYKVVNKEGKTAFLKALDFSNAFEGNGKFVAKELNILTDSYLNELHINEECSGKKLSRVAYSIDNGSVQVPNYSNMEGRVLYLIFEIATSDIRQQVNSTDSIDIVSITRILKDICLGLWQLHRNNIAHQDLKPSNIVDFDDKISKVTDFGRSTQRGKDVNHNDRLIPGDKSYAPPELLYGHLDPDFRIRRMGADIYNLGSIATYLYTGIDINSELYKNLDPRFRHDQWQKSYDEVVDYLEDAFGRTLERVRNTLPDEVADFMFKFISELCMPNYRKRGHPKNLAMGKSYDLERYYSTLNTWLPIVEVRARVKKK